jgi:ubiquinone/menaquinone biosynthesis C-methylase UbiE
MTSSSEQDYLLGANLPELERLRFQHEVWGELTRSFLKRLQVRNGWKCLDVGAGPGFVALDLAKMVGDLGELTLLEPSQLFLDYFQQQNAGKLSTPVRLIRGTVEETSLPTRYYDLIFIRWVIGFVSKPEQFLAKLFKALRPGGILAIQDYYYEGLSLFPKGGPFDRVPDLVRKYYESSGGDPYVTGKIPAWFRRHHIQLIDYTPNSQAGGNTSKIMAWAEQFFVLHLPRMAEKGLISSREANEIIADLQAHRKNPDAFFFSPVVIDLAGRA